MVTIQPSPVWTLCRGKKPEWRRPVDRARSEERHGRHSEPALLRSPVDPNRIGARRDRLAVG